MGKRWWTLLVVSAATFMLLLDVTIVTVVLPQIRSALNTSFADVQWVVDAYSITLASLLLIGGSLADRFGYRRSFVVGLVVGIGQSAEFPTDPDLVVTNYGDVVPKAAATMIRLAHEQRFAAPVG